MIKVKKVHPDAKLPQRNNTLDAGADLFSVETKTILPHSWEIFDTGIQIELDQEKELTLRSLGLHYYHRIAPRSGLAVKSGLDILAGICDSLYRGNFKIVLQNNSNEEIKINAGEKIAQLITEICMITDFNEVDSLEETSRGDKGFGSSGN